VPEETVMERSRRDRVPYDAWVRDGWLTATPGNVIDYDFIQAEALALGKQYKLRELAFDPWNATQTATQLGGEGLTMVEVRQGYRSFSEPAKELEKLIVAGKVRHGGHPILRWMVSNVAKREDPNGNIAPDKSASSEKIDGVVAAILALSRLIVQPPPAPEPSIWSL
jgi:phage terminase large subunit-like protein